MPKSNIFLSIIDENPYLRLRQQLLNIPTSTQSEANNGLTLANTDKIVKHTTNEAVLNQSVSVQEKKWIDQLILHYTHEKRLESYKRDIHQIWNQLFLNTPAMGVRLIVGNRNQQKIIFELMQTRPHTSLLRPKEDK